jgi:DNA-binding MarR family transcriptional regulator
VTEPLKPRLRTMFALVEAGRTMITRVEEIWGDAGVSPSEGAVLARLFINGDGASRSGDLLGHPIRSTPALAKILASLEADNLITRARSADDRRVVIVEATPDAATLFNQVLRRIENEVVATTTSNLTNTDIDALARLLASLNP